MKTITNPNEPASTRQTFAVFCKTGYDVRECKLTKQQASDILDGKAQANQFAGALPKNMKKINANKATDAFTVKAEKADDKNSFDKIYAEAHQAGMAAGTAIRPMAMIVTDPAAGRVYEPVMDGACGFAWIRFAANTAWGRWCKAKGYAKAAYPSGISVWVHEFNQSVERKTAYADAFAEVLRNYGIECHAGSRLD